MSEVLYYNFLHKILNTFLTEDGIHRLNFCISLCDSRWNSNTCRWIDNQSFNSENESIYLFYLGRCSTDLCVISNTIAYAVVELKCYINLRWIFSLMYNSARLFRSTSSVSSTSNNKQQIRRNKQDIFLSDSNNIHMTNFGSLVFLFERCFQCHKSSSRVTLLCPIFSNANTYSYIDINMSYLAVIRLSSC